MKENMKLLLLTQSVAAHEKSIQHLGEAATNMLEAILIISQRMDALERRNPSYFGIDIKKAPETTFPVAIKPQ